MTTITAPDSQRAAKPESAMQRQFVNFMFFRVDRAFRALPADVKTEAKRELASIIERYHGPMIVLPYSTLGLKAGVDFMLWRIGFDIDPFQKMAADINQSVLGRYLDVPQSFLAMTKHSQYVEEHVHEGQEGRRLRIVPGKRPFLFVYPFVKTRDWYLLPQSERQRIMNEHIAIGHKYPRVKINTTYSFGLDDQDFVVAFESDTADEFLDLVQELRETESSKYTVRDTPMFTCRRTTMEEILDSIG
ncbi:MAG TPA: chlorite dismutase family protein [Thermoanaerobaculia bacterium]|nr:chlorite dismutase family protein [Thermoanaerobaculia bacterium]